ncbi:hypothetical protein GRF59_15065 [Paenibacillus sp. HJL G12]|uniref:Uncharacterized protein n=1 Tax=Paenibacillus dendrobii TaxID=2691084 RepID=A0A7X3IKB6_9BACL|nr:hypothetical protein [Paenibacillus dendrobii]MWV44941.1 hypothetical protein [Paenibacillus dendrobii]
MKLFKIYEGTIKAMQNTPCKIAIFTGEGNIKVFQKAFYKNKLNRPNWVRNIILERNNINSIESIIRSSGYSSK